MAVVDCSGRLVVQGLVRPAVVVKVEIIGQAATGFFRVSVVVQVHLFILDVYKRQEQWHPEVQRAKNSPQSKSIPIYGFGSHVDTVALKAARAAGCDHIWARSRFVLSLIHI